MNKRILEKILLITIFAFAIWLFTTHVNAAYISISLDKKTASPGEKVSGTISSDCIGRVNLSSSNGTVSPDRVWIEGGSQSFTITVGNSGTASISATPEGGVMSSGGTDVGVSGASATISISTSNGGSVSGGSSSSGSGSSGSSSSSGSTSGSSTTTTPEKKSSNANLSNLGIRPNDFSGFTPGTTTYNVTVPEDVESVEVYATAQDSGATVSGTGNKALEYGENALSVVVTAEDGTTKTYTINVTREGEGETDEGEDVETASGLSNITIGNLELSPSFKTNVYEYTVKYIGEDTSLDIQTVATDPSYTVEILGNEDLKEGENTITILVADSEGSNVATYQITVNKSLVDEEALAREEQEKQQQEQRKMFMIAGGIIFIILIIIIIIVIKRRRNRTYAEEFSGVPFAGINNEDDYYNDYDNENQYGDYNDGQYTDSSQEDNENGFLSTEKSDQENNQEMGTELNFDDSKEKKEKEKAKKDFLEGYNSDDKYEHEENKPRRGRKKGKRFK